MTVWVEAIMRLTAWVNRRALPRRSTWSLASETVPPYMVAIIRLAGEESIQGIAAGRADRPPNIAVRWNALDRGTDHLSVFAQDFLAYVQSSLSDERIPRLWVGTGTAFEALVLLSVRYMRSKLAPEKIRELATLIGLLAEDAQMPGQQSIAIAASLLAQHTVTGQSKMRDGDLQSLLCWIDPQPDEDPRFDADLISQDPTASMLDLQDDDRVEDLRRIANGTSSDATRARMEIEKILTVSVEREWNLLHRARNAFWSLPLQTSPGTQKLVQVAVKRLQYAVTRAWYPTRSVHGLANLYREHEYLTALVESLDVRYDDRVRELYRLIGRVISAQVASIQSPAMDASSCVVTLVTKQSSLHIRVGGTLQTVDWSIQGRVSAIVSEYGRDETTIYLNVSKGARALGKLETGTVLDWADTVVFDGRTLFRKAYQEMGMLNNPQIYVNRPSWRSNKASEDLQNQEQVD